MRGFHGLVFCLVSLFYVRPITSSNINWFVRDATETSTCLLLNANNATVYFPMSGKADLQIPVLDGAVSMSGSSCGNVSQTLVVIFNPKQANGSEWKLTLTFSPYGQGGFKLLNYTLDGSRPPNGTEAFHYTMARDAVMDTKTYAAKHGFHCSNVALALSNDTSRIVFQDLNVTAFAHFNETATFPADYEMEKCAMDDRTSDIVPIVVGACLAALVIVVLIAYLIGRARAKRQGYASV